MANDQFQIPTNSAETEIRAQIDAIEIGPRSPEYAPTPVQRVRDSEENVIMIRSKLNERLSQVQQQAKGRGFLRGLVPGFGFGQQFKNANDPLHDEWEMLYQKKKQSDPNTPHFQFWFDTRNEGVGEWWYHAPANPAQGTESVVLHFQTTSTGIFKLHDGREYPTTAEEPENLANAAEEYSDILTQRWEDSNLAA